MDIGIARRHRMRRGALYPRRFAAALCVTMAGAGIGCGGQTVTDATDSGPRDGSPGAHDTGTPPAIDSGLPDAPNDANPTGSCPASIPSTGAPCSEVGQTCEFGGTGDHLLCSTNAFCQGGADGVPATWYVFAPDPTCIASPAQNPATCPSKFDTLPTGASCPSNTLDQCVYDEGVCGCRPCGVEDGGAPTVSQQWVCMPWLKPAGCPEPRPRVGSACDSDGMMCIYENACSVTDGQPYLVCSGGSWTIEPHGASCALPRCT